MRAVIITNSELPLSFFDTEDKDRPLLLLTADPKLARKMRKQGFSAATGDLSSPRLYKRAGITRKDRILLHLCDSKKLDPTLSALFEAVPYGCATVMLGPRGKPSYIWGNNRVRFVHTTALDGPIVAEMERTALQRSAARVREIFEDGENILFLLQDDPDPDGIASALALRALLGRNRQTTTIGSFGSVTRPENIAMVKLLDILVKKITPADLEKFDRIALLDLQPYHSPDIPKQIDAVFDHHPRRPNYTSKFRDIRPKYGATATMMTEYLQATSTTISQRLATALLYGIKTDTQLLGRKTTKNDVEAFAALYPLANHSLLSRIDRPQIPRSDLGSVSNALEGGRIIDDILFAHMGPLTREDVIPYIADLCLEVENVELSVVSGIFEGNLICSVRSFGAVGKSAGDATKAAFEPYGSAGGHKTMAKAVIPLHDLPEDCFDHAQWICHKFLEVMHENTRHERE